MEKEDSYCCVHSMKIEILNNQDSTYACFLALGSSVVSLHHLHLIPVNDQIKEATLTVGVARWHLIDYFVTNLHH